MAVSGESSFTYSYNAANQLSSVTNPNSVQISFTYDGGGRRTRTTDPGSYVEYVYNARNWLTDVRNRTTGGTTRYDATYYYQDGNLWDHTGNPVRRVENLAGSTFTTAPRSKPSSPSTGPRAWESRCCCRWRSDPGRGSTGVSTRR